MMTGVVESVPSEAKRNKVARRFTRMLEDCELGLFDAFHEFRHRVSVVEKFISSTSQLVQASVVRCRTLWRRGAHLVVVCKWNTAGFAKKAAKRVRMVGQILDAAFEFLFFIFGVLHANVVEVGWFRFTVFELFQFPLNFGA